MLFTFFRNTISALNYELQDFILSPFQLARSMIFVCLYFEILNMMYLSIVHFSLQEIVLAVTVLQLIRDMQ